MGSSPRAKRGEGSAILLQIGIHKALSAVTPRLRGHLILLSIEALGYDGLAYKGMTRKVIPRIPPQKIPPLLGG